MNNIRRQAYVVAALIMSVSVSPVSAHEMFLKPQNSLQEPRSDQVIRLINGTFDKSENSIARDRMSDVSIVAGDTVTKPSSYRIPDRLKTQLKKRAKTDKKSESDVVRDALDAYLGTN